MTETPDLTWMLEEHLLKLVPGTRSAVLLSTDGLLMAHSGDIGRDDAQRVAAGLSGLKATVRAVAGFCHATHDSWQQTLTEFEDGFIMVVAAGHGANLGVATSKTVDIEGLSSQLQKLVQGLGKVLATQPRSEPPQLPADAWFLARQTGNPT